MLIANPVTTLFTARKISIVSDSTEFLSECRKLGFLTRALGTGSRLPRHSLIFSFSKQATKLAFEMARHTPSKKCIFCPLHVFDASVNAGLYGLNLILRSDFIAALKAQEKILALLDKHRALHLIGEHTTASVSITPDSTPYAMVKKDLQNNFIHSVAEFFEVHYAHMNPDHPCPFCVEGTLKVSGILSACRNISVGTSENLEKRINELIKSVSAKPATITIRQNQVISFKNEDGEHLKLLEEAAGARRLYLTEFAIGVNGAIQPVIDYAINSQLNEGVEGIHLAIGDGSTGYHIDFLSPAVAAVPI